MAEIELVCAVYGEGTVFPVKIVRNAKVSALQEAIAVILSTKQHAIPPRLLTLYLARENGEWLKDVDSMDAFLRGEIDKQCTKMRSTWTLADEKLFGEEFQPGRREIHVLVEELPKAAIGSVSSLTAKLEKQIDEIHEQIVQTKRKRYVHSDMSSNKGNALLRDLNIRVKPVDTVSLTAGDSAPVQVQAFEWESVCDGSGQNIALTEEQQRDRERYREYVECNIGDVLKAKKLCVLGVEKDTNILSIVVPGHDIDLVGRTDILVLSAFAEQFPHYVELLPEVKMLIEVKRVMKAGCSFQALSELIALDFLVDDPVMALLTNLTDRWQFFWVSEKKKYVIIQTTTITEPGAAFAMIRTLLAQSQSADAEISLPYIEEPVKRRKLAEVLPSITEGGESNCTCSLASVLGPDIEMARAVANQVTPFSQATLRASTDHNVNNHEINFVSEVLSKMMPVGERECFPGTGKGFKGILCCCS